VKHLDAATDSLLPMQRLARMGSRGHPGHRGGLAGIVGLVWLLCGLTASAESVTIAVAANFLSPLKALEAEFKAATTHEVIIVAGSTGQLYAQIINSAPFDVLLAADQARPERLVREGFADADTRFTYAIGRLALWTRHPTLRDQLSLELLGRDEFRWLAIANPELAPYGQAARQTLETMGLWEALQSRLVQGQNIAQTFAMVDTGNAELGLVALSQALEHAASAAHVVVPATWHEPIRQDAILLQRARDNLAAIAFVQFMQSSAASRLLQRFGYERPKTTD